MKAQFEFSETLLDLIIVICMGILVAFILTHLVGFKGKVDTITRERVGIDIGEAILSASCLVERKGVFVEDKLNKNFEAMPCLDIEVPEGLEVTIEIKPSRYSETGWKKPFGEVDTKRGFREVRFLFPALLKNSTGGTETYFLSITVREEI